MENLVVEWYVWAGFLLIVLGCLAFDLGVLHKKNEEVKFKAALKTVCFYVLLAVLFGCAVYYFGGHQKGVEFFTGYIIEMILSVDNIFVIALILGHFMVPKIYHHRVLFWGVLVAIVLRFAFILAGTALISKFDWILYLFGAFLIITGLKMIKASDEEPDLENNKIIKLCKKNLRTTEDYEGEKFWVRKNGLLYFTPLFVVLMVVNFVDIVFAFDSIPAIFAITTDPFIVYTSNIFAILGLRSMYFVLANIIQRFAYLKYGLSVILVLIGTKMILNHAYYPKHVISTEASLIATAMIILVSILYSLYKTKGKLDKEATITGWVPGSEEKKED